MPPKKISEGTEFTFTKVAKVPSAPKRERDSSYDTLLNDILASDVGSYKIGIPPTKKIKTVQLMLRHRIKEKKIPNLKVKVRTKENALYIEKTKP